MEQCDGCCGISDDIIIFGTTEEDHNRRLLHFLNVARKEGLQLNSARCGIKASEITFFGRKYTSNGLFPDPQKVEDIIQIPIPADKQDLQRFLGMVNFITPHLTHLSQLTSPLCDLLKELTPWPWDDGHQTIFEKVKQLVSTNICQQYYDPNEEVQLEVDASIKGLGATLVQNSKPVAFACKALTSAQANYSNIIYMVDPLLLLVITNHLKWSCTNPCIVHHPVTKEWWPKSKDMTLKWPTYRDPK